MNAYKMAYKKLLNRGFYEEEIDSEKLYFIISKNYKGWADLSERSIDMIQAYVCKTGFEED